MGSVLPWFSAVDFIVVIIKQRKRENLFVFLIFYRYNTYTRNKRKIFLVFYKFLKAITSCEGSTRLIVKTFYETFAHSLPGSGAIWFVVFWCVKQQVFKNINKVRSMLSWVTTRRREIQVNLLGKRLPRKLVQCDISETGKWFPESYPNEVWMESYVKDRD